LRHTGIAIIIGEWKLAFKGFEGFFEHQQQHRLSCGKEYLRCDDVKRFAIIA
jgi:hypothetical protein